MKKLKQVKKTKKVDEVKKEVNKDVKEMLEGYNFKQNDIPVEQQKKYPGYVSTFTVKVKSGDSEQVHLLICSVFEDAYRFSVMDEVGIIRLVSFRNDTPADVLEKYIRQVATVLEI